MLTKTVDASSPPATNHDKRLARDGHTGTITEA
jgi:hypothetical protein